MTLTLTSVRPLFQIYYLAEHVIENQITFFLYLLELCEKEKDKEGLKRR